MTHLALCAFILLFALKAMPQADSAHIATLAKDTLLNRRSTMSNAKEAAPVNMYLFHYYDSLSLNKRNTGYYQFSYMPDAKDHKLFLNIAAPFLLEYLKAKTNHPYQYKPANTPH